MSLCSFVDELYKSNTVELQLSQMRVLVFIMKYRYRKARENDKGQK